MRTYLKALCAAAAVVGFAGSAFAWDLSVESTSDSTSTTSDITTDDARIEAVQRDYLSHNYMSVARDAAVGGGEHLGAFASLLGCDKRVQPRFFQQAKRHHRQIFAPRTDAAATLVAAKRVLAADKVLATSCRVVAQRVAPPAP